MLCNMSCLPEPREARHLEAESCKGKLSHQPLSLALGSGFLRSVLYLNSLNIQMKIQFVHIYINLCICVCMERNREVGRVGEKERGRGRPQAYL